MRRAGGRETTCPYELLVAAMILCHCHSSSHARTARGTREEAMAGIPLWALKKGDAQFRWEQEKGLGARASQESSMTFGTPAASSPTVVNPEAICYDLSILEPTPTVAAALFHWQSAGKATGRRLERRGTGRRRTLHLSS